MKDYDSLEMAQLRALLAYDVNSKVIAIRNHPEMAYKVGDVFDVYCAVKSMCHCVPPLIHIGLPNNYRYWLCDVCHCSGKLDDDIFWATSADFALYDNSLSSLTLEDIMQEIESLKL